YAFYLDDSGTKDYSPSGYPGSGPTRYFVFAGLLATQDASSQLSQRLRDLKRTISPRPIEIKSNWLRMPNERTHRYLNPLGLTEAGLRQFVDNVYDLVLQAEIELLACVVDKQHMIERYGEGRAYYPPAVAYEALVQRVQNALVGKGRCQVFIDDMTGKNPKGNEHKANLIAHHTRLRKHGSRMGGRTITIDVLGDLRFQSSARSELIQVADLVAYNVYRQFIEHGEDWERVAPELPTYSYFERLAPKFRSGPGKRVQGYGIVKMPLRKRVPWASP
ncbi:MAG: DUF3800 domain-containing protein, partial [Fimbriimonadaceae bacterium]|nr:DUF3800 domain-containing protein [Fimbriimonadaceae bacterium]